MGFNLLDEPWIRVMDESCKVTEVSITQALVDSHRFTSLAGESPAQNVAILRLLIAIVHTVFYRVDENGCPAMLGSYDDALDRWETLWKAGAFPEGPIQSYLAQWRDRFNLLDPDRPFYQVPEESIPLDLKKAFKTTARLNGIILESENKARIFSSRISSENQSMLFAEAARWLLFLNAFDDCSVAPKYRKDIGTGWLGKLGLIYAQGSNLFETIMLNNPFVNWNRELYATPKPVWEAEVRTADRCRITMPDNIPELFTLQSRRTHLITDGQSVTGYYTHGGDTLESLNAFPEPMTTWQKKKDGSAYVPRPYEANRNMWRDFSAIISNVPDSRQPGVIQWLTELQSQQILEADRILQFGMCAITYGSQNCGVDNSFSDSLSFHADLLAEAGSAWRMKIEDQIRFTDKVAFALAVLVGEIAVAAGKHEVERKTVVPPGQMQAAEAAKAQYYFRIDAAFRRWLLRPEAGQDSAAMDAICADWRREAIQIAREIGTEEIEKAGQAAMLGRWIESEQKGVKTKRHYSTAEASNRFCRKLNQLAEGE